MLNKRLCRNSRICLSFPVVYGSVWQVVGDQHPKIRRNVFDESKEVDYVYLLVIKYSIKILRDKHCLSYCLSYSAGDLGFSPFLERLLTTSGYLQYKLITLYNIGN